MRKDPIDEYDEQNAGIIIGGIIATILFTVIAITATACENNGANTTIMSEDNK